MNKIEIDDKTALVTINGISRKVEIELNKHDIFCFTSPLFVGVKIGNGSKLWRVKLEIRKNDRYRLGSLSGAPEYVLHAQSPLNTVNRRIPFISIVDWAENIPDGLISKR